MYSDNASTNPEPKRLLPQALYRGLYVRVARRLGVDPSYVSRVARGERYSKHVEDALHRELGEIGKRLGRRIEPVAYRSHRGNTGERLRSIVRKNRSWFRQEWLVQSQADPNLRSIRISPRKRTSPLWPLVCEALKLMRYSPREMATASMKVAPEHGRIRRIQNYSATSLAEEYNLMRRCISVLAEKHFPQMDGHLLLHDLAQLGEALDVQLQTALRSFLDQD
jgi:transcriptional regulator with XRE-family HTH domain